MGDGIWFWVFGSDGRWFLVFGSEICLSGYLVGGWVNGWVEPLLPLGDLGCSSYVRCKLLLLALRFIELV